MTTELVLPAHIAGFGIGDRISLHDTSSFLSDGGEFGCEDLVKDHPDVSLVVCGGIVVSVTVADECMHGSIALIGNSPIKALESLGLTLVEKEGSEIEIWTLSGGVELYVRDGVVTRLSLSDWTLVSCARESMNISG